MMPAATPDNPMGQSQKYMMYIMPFFALSGLYWPFGLVLYWVTTNCWTLGQQWVLFRTQPQLRAAGAAGAAGAAATSPAIAPVVTTRPKRAVAGQPKPGSTGSPAGRDGKKDSAEGTGSRAGGGAVAQSNGAAKPSAGRRSPDGSAPGSAGRKASAARGPAAKETGTSGSTRQGAAPSANGTGTGGGAGAVLRRLGKRAEPEPEPSVPEVKLVRQQRQRQSRSKRSGKR
jgi:YidC/Oxa1 family membrane protein insertase